MLGLALETVERVVAHQTLRPAHFGHDFIAGVDAGRAADALHLQAVANIDARRADDHAAFAVDAIAVARIAGLASGLTPIVVVADDHRVAVGHRRLEAAVGTDDQAELLAEPAEVEVQDGRHHDDPGEGGRVLGRASLHHVDDRGKRHEVADEHVREQRARARCRGRA